MGWSELILVALVVAIAVWAAVAIGRRRRRDLMPKSRPFRRN